MQIAECLEHKFDFEATDLVRITCGWFDAEFGNEPMSLFLGYDVYTYEGSKSNFDVTHWILGRGDILMQIHVSQYIGSPTFENVVRSYNASKSLFALLGDTCEKYKAKYVVSATDMTLSLVLLHFIPSFVPVDSLNVQSKLAQHIRYRRPQREKTYFPVMVARGTDFIQDTQKFS